MEETIDLYDIHKLIDLEEKKLKVPSLAVNSKIEMGDVLSSGSLTRDLVLGGGYKKGSCVEIVGPEHSGKTASLYEGFSSALLNIPGTLKGIFLDNEGQVDPPWFENITNHRVDDVFGVKDEKTGLWLNKPKIRYYKPETGEKGLKLIRRILERMPDKLIIGNTWYYCWSPKPSKKVEKSGGYTLADLRKILKGLYSKKLHAKTGNFFVKVPGNYGGPEFMIGNDSWATMVPEAVAEDDSDALGSPARMFAKHCNNIKTKCGSKGVILLGINQIREKPMAFGCVHADTIVPFVDGRNYTIREIVDNKIEGEVFSYNERVKRIEPRKIIDWFYNGKVDKKEDWITIAANAIDTKNGVLSFTVTPDHKVLVVRKKKIIWIEAKNIKVGDRLISKYIDFDLYYTDELKKASVLVTDTVVGSERKFRQKDKYDIAVEGNKNYLVGNKNNGIIIHNSPMYFPGGNVIKHMTDTRLLYTSSYKPIEEGNDRYKNYKINSIKNKLFVPHKQCESRWWFEHNGESGFGTDPVLDVHNYLKMTGQLLGTRQGLRIKFKGTKKKKLKKLAKEKYSFKDFKQAVLDPKDFGIDLRKACFGQLQSGRGVKLFLKNSNIKKENVDG